MTTEQIKALKEKIEDFICLNIADDMDDYEEILIALTKMFVDGYLKEDIPKHETIEECKTPNQPIVFAEDGCIRFMQNKIIDRLLDIATELGYSLNEISRDQQNGEYRIEDYKQLIQLIGYSVSGYGDLNEVSHEEACKFDEIAQKLANHHGKPEIDKDGE